MDVSYDIRKNDNGDYEVISKEDLYDEWWVEYTTSSLEDAQKYIRDIKSYSEEASLIYSEN